MTLAYVFWHRPRPGTARAAYEAALRGFQDALRADPPPGWRAASVHRLDRAPWLEGDGPAYEDWYLVDDWAALGRLNDAAVAGSRRIPHDEAAAAAGPGGGGIYRRVLGSPRPHGAHAAWFAKPPGLSYAELGEELDARVGARDVSLWQRQMVLGAAPEFCLLADEPVPIEGWSSIPVVRSPLNGG